MKKLLIVAISGCLLGGCVGYDDGPSRGYGSSYYRGNSYTPYYEDDERMPAYRPRDYSSRNYHRDDHDHDHRDNGHKNDHKNDYKDRDRSHDNHRSNNRPLVGLGADRVPRQAGGFDYENGQQP